MCDGVLTVTPDTPEALEWRSRRSVIDTIASCSDYLQEDDEAASPGDLYGRFTWRIDKFSEITKRELRSDVFQVGGYNWYILVYPQGCDVANHLSLFLCVADHDQLLPGWSHFSQFTIAVVNREPKASKYSDTLHRFCKKEHDWGWKKFMELGKLGEGFLAQDALVIKAQVQVLRDVPAHPFFCLDSQYRRELVRVYLSNVEGIARRFAEERRAWLASLLAGAGEGSFRAFWASLPSRRRAELSCAAAGPLLRGLVKWFFNEKEVTSTLVMDALVAACRMLEAAGHVFLAGGTLKGADGAPGPGVLIDGVRGAFFLAGDALAEGDLGDAAGPAAARSGGVRSDVRRRAQQQPRQAPADASGPAPAPPGVEHDERRLAELGRWILDVYVVSEIARLNMEAAWVEAETVKRQEALIREEEAAEREERRRAAARLEAERERRARKKEKERAKKQNREERERLQAAKKAEEEEQKRERQRAERARRAAEAEETLARRAAEAEETLARRAAEDARRAAAKAAKKAEAEAELARQESEAAGRPEGRGRGLGSKARERKGLAERELNPDGRERRGGHARHRAGGCRAGARASSGTPDLDAFSATTSAVTAQSLAGEDDAEIESAPSSAAAGERAAGPPNDGLREALARSQSEVLSLRARRGSLEAEVAMDSGFDAGALADVVSGREPAPVANGRAQASPGASAALGRHQSAPATRRGAGSSHAATALAAPAASSKAAAPGGSPGRAYAQVAARSSSRGAALLAPHAEPKGKPAALAGAGARHMPRDAQRGLQTPPLESPGLDDFAHIGLINDLLE
ncbi:hypothetical protein QBZ16_000297 [Prototheca wickerhamii]|uniref:MATH domain-containing protein n=1 Tax=Prototheca wickerhamii TaxID=3111 RepID=A0AAD9MIN3_PROWI|nr:hypothetical protein QBZ16_000297 [Prototheca wickerhamii]